MTWAGTTPKGNYGWLGGPGATELAYFYGYPAYTGAGTQPNVDVQWIFDEGSGAIVDEVASVSLAVTGSPTFGVTASSPYSNLSPGITYSAGAYHKKNSATTQMDFTNQHTVEAWFKSSVTTGTAVFFDTEDNAFVDGAYCAWQKGTNNLQVRFKATDTTTVTANITMTATTYANGDLHKIRITINFSGLLTVLVNGSSLGTADLSSLSGKTVDCATFTIGAFADGSSTFDGTFFEFRKSNNLTNNSGGKGGG